MKRRAVEKEKERLAKEAADAAAAAEKKAADEKKAAEDAVARAAALAHVDKVVAESRAA